MDTCKFIAFQLAVVLTWVAFREPSLDAIRTAAGRASAWWGADTLLAMVLLAALLGSSWVEEWMESHFAHIVRMMQRTPFPLLSVIYGALLFLVLIGAGSATTFIYQRF